MNATVKFPPPHPDRLAEPLILRVDAVSGSFRYTIIPAASGLRGSHPISIPVECLYDCGKLITNLWASLRTLEEAKDELRRLEAEHRGRSYKKRLIYEHNNLFGWTDRSAEIEARKLNSPKRCRGYRWEPVADRSVPHGRFILKGTLMEPSPP